MEETLDQLQARHRKEQRDLQSRITQKKKNATKKTRKGVNDECAELERQLRARQELEIRRLTDPDPGRDGYGEEDDDDGDNLNKSSEPAADADHHHEPDPAVNDELASKLESANLVASSSSRPPSQGAADTKNGPTAGDGLPQGGGGGPGSGKKRNRQKERLARRAAEVEAAAAAAAEEASAMTDHRGGEKSRMDAFIASHGLAETEVAPDGHCLFAAFADGLRANGIDPYSSSSSSLSSQGLVGTDEKPKMMPYRVVRRAAAGYMASHGDAFAGFLEEPLAEYVAKIRDTAGWGGQLELSALANSYGVEVRVVQDGRTEVIAPLEDTGAGKDRKTVWLAYYRHGYGLGEHYNSLRKRETNAA